MSNVENVFVESFHPNDNGNRTHRQHQSCVLVFISVTIRILSPSGAALTWIIVEFVHRMANNVAELMLGELLAENLSRQVKE